MTEQFTIAEMEALILSAVKEWAGVGVTFAQLERTIPSFCDNGTLYADDSEFVIIWEGIAHEAIRAIKSLRERGLVHLRRSSLEAYALDGRTIKIKIEREGKPAPHGVFVWRPTAVCLGPGPMKAKV